MKKVLSIILCLVMFLWAFVSTPIISSANVVDTTTTSGDDYPYRGSTTSVVDQWNFYSLNCTSFCAWRLNNNNGVAFHNHYLGVQWGNAKNWDDAARQVGIPVDNSPALGGIACWNRGTYGHVAWVSNVTSDGSIDIEEYNYGGRYQYVTRHLAASDPDCFIHIKDIENGHDPTGVLDIASGGEGTVYIRGWAFDEDDRNAQLEIHVYIGGSAGDANAEGHGGIIANGHRSDVNNVYGCGEYHGYDTRIPTTKTGSQTVSVYAINVGSGSNNLIGSATVNIKADTEKPTVDNAYFDQVKSDGYWPCFTVKDNVGIKSVRVATWTRSDQSDLIWHDASNNGVGTYFVEIKRSDYSSTKNTIYHNHAYIYDYSGNVAFAAIDMDYRIKSETGKNIPEGEYRIVSAVNTNRALDVNNSNIANDTNIQIFSNLNNKKQTFNFQYADKGFYRIINSNSNKPIDVEGDTYLNNTNVIQSSTNGGANQEWMIKPTGNNDGYYYIIARSNGLALDVANAEDKDGANVQVYTQNQSTAQKWKLRRVLKDEMVAVKDVTIKSETDEISPKITVTVDDDVIAQDGNYEVEITTDLAAGKGTVTVTGIDKYCDSVTKEFNISVSSSILGDADGDGEVSSIDATLIQRYDALLDTGIDEDVLMNGDVDGNGELEIIDATWLQRYLAYMDVPYLIDEPIG